MASSERCGHFVAVAVVEPKTSPVRQCECTRTSGGGPDKIAAHQRDVLLAVHVAGEDDHAEIAVARGQHAFGHAAHVALVAHAVADQFGDGEQLQPVLAAEFGELRQARHACRRRS